MSLSSRSVSHTPTTSTSTSTSSSSAALSLALASASGPPGECAATSSSLATLLTSGGIDTRESLFGYLQGLTASPRVTDEEQRERERLYRRLVKRQRRACLPRSVKDNTNNGNELPSASRQRAAAGDVGLSGTTRARERKRQRTKAADDGSKIRERSGSHSLGAAASEGIGGDRPQGAFARPVPSWIPSPVALASSSSSLQVLNSSSPYGSSSSTTSSPSPSPSLYDPYTTSSSTGSIGSLLSSAGAFEPVPIVPRPSGAASFLPPHRAQQRPPSPLAARHLVGGQLSSPPPWDRHDESYHHHSLQQQPPPPPPYLDRGQHTSRGLYAPGNLVTTPLSAPTPMRQEQRSLPAASPSRHHQSTVGSYNSLELETERYPQQRHHTAAYPEWLGGASSSSAPAAVQVQQDARQRDPVACLEWDCPLEGETFAECSSSFGSSPAPPLFAHDHALPYHPYQPPHLQHAHQQQPHLQQQQQQQHQHQQQQQQHYHLRAALTEAHQRSTQIAYNQVGGGRGTEDSEDVRLSPSELADLLLLYPDFRQSPSAPRATSDPTTTALPLAPTASAGSMTGAAAAAALPSLGVSVPSPLFAWLAGSL